MIHHPDTSPATDLGVAADAIRNGNILRLNYTIRDPEHAVLQPAPSNGQRRDNLWQTTCFEAFIRAAGAIGYHEFNFSPSGDWASYSFDAHRAGMRDAPGQPVIERTPEGMNVTLDLSAYPDLTGTDWHVGLTTVIEEKDGTKSYWALKHPTSAPDFHDAACFILELPALG